MSCSHLSTGPSSAETGPPGPHSATFPVPHGAEELLETSRPLGVEGGLREGAYSDLLAFKSVAPPFLPSRAT